MRIVLLSQPSFLESESMVRFARMLENEYTARGHSVTIWSPVPRAYHCVPRGRLSKWAGYVDQFLLFPRQVRAALEAEANDTLFVFCDQALGPWVPLVKDRPHVVHCHDLLALRSALGEFRENPTALTGRIYQRYIRRGFRQAQHFISISKKTREDLHGFGGVRPSTSEVVYNGLNYPYTPMAPSEAQQVLAQAGLPVHPRGMLLYVGHSAWYKNTAGLIRLYAQYARQTPDPLALWMVSGPPSPVLRSALTEVPPAGQVLFFKGIENRAIQAAYSHARVLLFPSLAEGFGWPLVEAQACGCPVITTNDAPMNEVAGPAARYLPRLRFGDDIRAWAEHGAQVLMRLLALTDAERAHIVSQGLEWAANFSAERAIDAYLGIYQQVMQSHTGSPSKRLAAAEDQAA